VVLQCFEDISGKHQPVEHTNASPEELLLTKSRKVRTVRKRERLEVAEETEDFIFKRLPEVLSLPEQSPLKFQGKIRRL
jgi:hypothetical protein